MKIGRWNGRGLGNGLAICSLVELQKEEDPDMLFLSETKMVRARLEWLRWKMGMTNMIVKDCEGQSGGLALFWHEACLVDILGKDARFIDALVHVHADAEQWRVTFVYGEPPVENRHLMWAKLQGLTSVCDRPWLVIGDFNEALWDFEHLLATPRPEQQMIAFRDTLEVCGLIDLGFSGIPFTYDNLRVGASNVKVRLDRATATNEWRNLFPFYTVQHVV